MKLTNLILASMVAMSLCMEAQAAPNTQKQTVKVVVDKKHCVPQTEYAAQILERKIGSLPKIGRASCRERV